MGFDFNRAGGAGGKVSRRMHSGLNNIDAGHAVWGFPNTAPTSPQYVLNNSMSTSAYISGAWTNATETNTANDLTLSFGTTYWIDLLWIGIAEAAPTALSINGNSVQYPVFTGGGFGQAGFYLDVYGYGLTATLGWSGGTEAKIGPQLARTIITTSGVAVWPPGLSGRQVARDI